jgi:septum formation protein
MLINQLKKYNIILASQSPRRQYLLKEAGINFEVRVKNNIEEIYPTHLKGEEIAQFLAEHKSTHYLEEIDVRTILITADTIVWLKNSVLGKPRDYDDAYLILSKLSGQKHEVITGVCLKSINKMKTFTVTSKVYFKELTHQEITYYLDNYEPYDKAGAYGIQEWIGFIAIEKIEGCYFNVMGLPIQRLYVELENFIIS